MQTRRYPRTMCEAFGPYAGNRLEPMPQPRRPFWTANRIIMVLLVQIAVCIAVFGVF